MYRNHLIRKHVKFYCGLFYCIFLLMASAVYGAYGTRENELSPKEQRIEQMRQQAEDSAAEIDQVLEDFLELSNKNQRPQQAQIQQAITLLDESKRFAGTFEEEEKAQFMLLQAWASFYEKNTLQALNWSARACKTNEASRDAWNSQALFSMLLGKSPRIPQMDKPEPKPRPRLNSRRRRNTESEVSKPTVQPYSQQGILDFDIFGVNPRVFRESLGRLQLRAASGETIEYKPGSETLCMLIRQDPPITPDDANDLQQQIEQAPRELIDQAVETMDPQMQLDTRQMLEGTDMGAVGGIIQSQASGYEKQKRYLERLMRACEDQSGIKFVQLNTFQPPRQVALNALPDFSQEKIPVVVAAVPESGARQFLGWGQDQPYMAIVDKTGEVKYAAAADGFMPAFILTELTGVPIDLEKKPQHTDTEPMQMPEMMMQMMDMMMGKRAPNQITDPNQIADPNAPTVKPTTTRTTAVPQQQPDLPTLSLEDQIRAQKLLQSAQMHIEESRKLRMKNPRQGIEDARKVLELYPNTPYADQAREFLRRVPDRWKQRHNITDEELGY